MKKRLWIALRGYRFENLVPPQLTDRLASAFQGNDPSTRAFAGKIARKHGWTTRHALRAVAEYKKFVYLGMVADFPVTPPKAIDIVWHEHLLFTRAYRDFCNQVLGRPFDHNPELLPEPDQTAQFHAQYDATLALYRHEFNAAPPADLWGTPKFVGAAGADAPASLRRQPAATAAGDDGPLFLYFQGTGDASSGGGNEASAGQGGAFSGGGGGTSWADDANADGSASDGAGAPADGGSSDGGSGCSSGCGGGE